MAAGTVARLDGDRGFGFIRPDEGGADLLFQASVVQGARFEELRAGQRVTFVAGPDPGDPARQRAVEVRPAVAGD